MSDEVDLFESLGIRFALGNADESHIENRYLIRGSQQAIEAALDTGLIVRLLPQISGDRIYPTRDLSIPEIQADLAWEIQDGLGNNLTGEGILVADLDTGIDWKHPDFWFADGAEYDWLDDADGIVENASDAIDLDGNSLASSNEALYYIDIDRDGTFNATTDWLWADSLIQDGEPQIGEPFFVVNDTNGNDALDLSEKVTQLSTPKTKYIVEKDGDPFTPSIIHWDRDGLGNLTSTTHVDTDGHGTGVAGILLGGQLGYRKYVGVAPSAELMMIKVFGASNERLTVLEGIQYAYYHGADVILIELGQWVEVFMDGSSTEEWWIDYVTSMGVPVIVPSGNLGGSDKHVGIDIIGPSFPSHTTDFNVPMMTAEIQVVWITFLSVNDTDFMQADFTILPPGGAPTLLHPNYGFRNWGMDTDGVTGTTFYSYVQNSSRGTKMMHIEIFLGSGLPLGVYPVNITLNKSGTVHGYIADSSSGWSGGAVWTVAADVKNEYLITWPSTADTAVSVASYHTRSFYGAIGSIASYSAIGPRIDGVQKQGVAAPGGWDIISDYTNESAWNGAWYAGPGGALPLNPTFGGYRLFSGTSAAGPHVAGAAALMLQSNPSSGIEVGSILTSTAVTDGFTG
ncbi:MAG: S8 family serine peptidase, partial [Candidatus Hodarchaeota archaeon]